MLLIAIPSLVSLKEVEASNRRWLAFMVISCFYYIGIYNWGFATV